MITPIKTIAVIGAGGMGACYASKFYEIDHNCISLVATGDRYDRLKEKGLIVNDKHYFFNVIRPEEKAPPSDFIIVAVKHHHLEEAIRDISNRVGENTLIISIMNGIESEEQIAAVYGADKLLYALAVGIDATRYGNSVTFSQQGKLFFGDAHNPYLSERVVRIQSLFDQAGIIYEIPEDMIRTLWWKFMINVGVNQASAALGAPYSVFQNSREARDRACRGLFGNTSIGDVGEGPGKKSLLGMEDPLQDGAPRINLLADPIESALKGLFPHEFRFEDHRRPIVLGPVLVEKPPLGFHVSKQGRSG